MLEDLPREESVIEHNILSQAVRLRPSESQTQTHTTKTRQEWIDYLVNLRDEMMAIDPIRTPSLIETLEEDLQFRDSTGVQFESVDEYIPYRLQNFDWE